MKSIILYTTQTGCTKKCAEYVQKNNNSDINLITKFNKSLDEYDAIVLLGPVYMGKVKKELLDFIHNNKQTLLKKKLFIALIGMNKDAFESMVEQNIDEDIRNHAEVMHGGGAYYLEKLGFIQKRVVKMVAKVQQSSEHIEYDNLDKIKI